MGEGGNKRSGACRGFLIGAAGGLLVTLALWLYFELARPSSYSRLFTLAYGPVVIVFAGLLGLVLGPPEIRISGELRGALRDEVTRAGTHRAPAGKP